MLSIIIPTLNEEKYLPKLLESINQQSYADYEIIVADNNSTDNTRLIAEKYSCKLVRGGKPAEARNNGAKSAKGEILLFIDADCILKHNFLKKSLNEMNRRNLAAAGCFVWPLNEKIIDNTGFAIFNIWLFLVQFFYPNASGSGIFCKRSLHEKIWGFDQSIVLSEDMDYARRAGKHARFRILNAVETYTSMRRFGNEGTLKTMLKLFLSAAYRILFGEIKTDIFKYKLEYGKRR